MTVKKHETITSTSNGRVRYIQALISKASFRKKEGKYVAEGIKMFEEADEKDILEVYVKEDAIASFDDKIKNKLEKTGYDILSDQVFKKVSDTVTPQGIICILGIRNVSLKDIVSEENPHIVVLENIQDPGNIGTIIRTAEGAGVSGIIMTKDCVDIFNPKVIRSTMGSIYRVKFSFVDRVEDALDILKENGIKTYACALSKDSRSYDEFDYQKPVAILIGNEGNGLKKSTIEASDETAYIPMCGQVESLNASVAASIMMYEVFRQRRQKG